MLDVLRADVGAGRELDVLRNADDDCRTAGLGDQEGLVQDARQILDPLDQPIVLGAGPGDADGVALLEGVNLTDQMGRNPPGDADQRDGTISVGEAGDRVGRRGRR